MGAVQGPVRFGGGGWVCEWAMQIQQALTATYVHCRGPAAQPCQQRCTRTDCGAAAPHVPGDEPPALPLAGEADGSVAPGFLGRCVSVCDMVCSYAQCADLGLSCQ